MALRFLIVCRRVVSSSFCAFIIERAACSIGGGVEVFSPVLVLCLLTSCLPPDTFSCGLAVGLVSAIDGLGYGSVFLAFGGGARDLLHAVFYPFSRYLAPQ